MGNPNANSLEESAPSPTVPVTETTKGEVMCADPFCRCHETQGSTHCGDCSILPIISVTLGLALPDHTWVEKTVEFEIDPEFEQNESFDLQETAANHLMAQHQEEIDKLAPSGWFLIAWEWKE